MLKEATLSDILMLCPFQPGDVFYYRPKNAVRSGKKVFKYIDLTANKLWHNDGSLSCHDTIVYWEDAKENVTPNPYQVGIKTNKEKEMDKSIINAFPDTVSAVLVEKHFNVAIESLPTPFRGLLVTQYAKELYEQAVAKEKAECCSTK